MFCARNTFLNASQQRDFCVQRPPNAQKFPPAAGAAPLKARVFLFKTHQIPKKIRLRRALGAIISFCRACSYTSIGRSPAKRKNLMNPHWTERFSFSCLRRAKHIILVLPIVFIRKTIRKTYFFRAFGPDQTFLPVGSMPAAGGFF